MEENMKGNIRWIERKDREFLVGLMEANILDNGIMENKMGMAYMSYLIMLRLRDYGRMVKKYKI